MRSVRRGEAAYLELMREAKAQFDAEIARNKEKGKAGRPRKEVAPVVVEDDDIEIDFSDVVPAEEKEEIAAPAPVPIKAIEKKKGPTKAPAKAPAKASAKVSVKSPAKKPAPRKSAPAAKKAPAKKTVPRKVAHKKAPARKSAPKKR